ncbi:MAG TPA: hypothetical protein VFF04_03350, partial [Candidatus Babeliales bacterium]|nr:hypothetical protein [Candidatus Babeliales bacterium]
MKISNIRISETKKYITLSATCQIRRVGLDEVRFTFAKEYKSFLHVDASPFAAALLLPSMKLGENLIIEGKISKQLYKGMHEIMKTVLRWDIGLKPIKIYAKEIVPDTTKPKIVATFFSGGVDSFYTYLRHKKDKKPITHFLFVKGFDIDPHNTRVWQSSLSNVQKIAHEGNVEIIEVETNIKPLIEPVIAWEYTYGACLASIGLCLRGGLKSIYIPSCSVTDRKFPCGSQQGIDHHWNTEQLSFIHDGSKVSRLNKIIRGIAKSPLALKYLRVCYMNNNGQYNCGTCAKCLRTMISLYVAGVLDKTATLPHQLDLKLIASLSIEEGHDLIFHKENLTGL